MKKSHFLNSDYVRSTDFVFDFSWQPLWGSLTTSSMYISTYSWTCFAHLRLLPYYILFVVGCFFSSLSSSLLHRNTMANKRMNERTNWCSISFMSSSFVFGLSPGLHVPRIIHSTTRIRYIPTFFLHYLVANTEQWTTKSTYSKTHADIYYDSISC